MGGAVLPLFDDRLPLLGARKSLAGQAQTGSGNLIVNGDAEAGYCTTDWNAATTLPGWSITAGSPDVICSSAGSFTYPSSPAPGKAFFAPGNQGDGAIGQTVNVASAANAIDGGGVSYNLEGWLGWLGQLCRAGAGVGDVPRWVGAVGGYRGSADGQCFGS